MCISRSEAGRRRVAAPLAAAAVVLCIALNAAPARASGAAGLDIFPDEHDLASGWLGFNAVVFTGFDAAFLIAWRPTPPVLSVVQILIGGIITPACVLSFEPDTALRVGAYGSIAFHVGAGFANLLLYPAFVKERERERRRTEPDWDPAYAWSLEPRGDGGQLWFRARL